MPDQLLLVGQTQPARRRSAGNDQSLRVHHMMSNVQQERTLAQIRAREMRHAILRAKAFRLLAHVLDQLRPHDPFRKAGEIFDQCSHGKLPARLVAFDDQRFQIGARGV